MKGLFQCPPKSNACDKRHESFFHKSLSFLINECIMFIISFSTSCPEVVNSWNF